MSGCASQECLVPVEAWSMGSGVTRGYTWLLPAIWVLGTKLESSARAASIFNPWAISVLLKILFLTIPNRSRFLTVHIQYEIPALRKRHIEGTLNTCNIIKVHLYLGRSHWVMQPKTTSNNSLVQHRVLRCWLIDWLVFLRQDHTVDVMSIVKKNKHLLDI